MKVLWGILDFSLEATMFAMIVLVTVACLAVGVFMITSFNSGGVAVVITGVVAGLIGALFVAASALDKVGN